jgi:lipopolysaccharide export system permease protein
MNILSGYLMRTILASTSLVLIVLLSLGTLFGFIAELDNQMGDYGIAQALLFTILGIPQLAFEMLPMATLIGALLGLGGLASNSELVVMRSAGLSVGRLSVMVAATGVVLMVFTALIGEYIGPPLDHFARSIRNEARFQQDERNSGNAAWVKDGPVILHLERVNSEFDFGRIYLFRFNDDNSLRSIARAENSGIDESDKWILENFRETRFQDDGVQVVQSSLAVESFDLSGDLLGITLVKPVSLSARGLLSYISYLKKNNLSSRQYETELWSRASTTLTIVLMPVLALAFVFGTLRVSGAGGRLMIGVLIGLGYYLASETIANSGQVYNLNPAFVTWLPSLALLGITVFALRRVQ